MTSLKSFFLFNDVSELFCFLQTSQHVTFAVFRDQIEHLQRQLAETQARNSSDDETSDEEDDEYYTSDGEDYDDDAVSWWRCLRFDPGDRFKTFC